MTQKLGLFCDIGWNLFGWCIGNLATKEIICSGCIETKSTELIEDRIFKIYQTLNYKIKEVTDNSNYLDLICIEEPCFNGKNGAILNRVLGMMYVLLGQYKTKYLTINPKTLKRLFTGHGTASKPAMLFETKKYFPDLINYLNKAKDDEIDSYALYLVYLLNNKIIDYVE